MSTVLLIQVAYFAPLPFAPRDSSWAKTVESYGPHVNLPVCQFPSHDESICILFDVRPFAKNHFLTHCPVKTFQVPIFGNSPNVSCDSSWTQIIELYYLHDKELISQFSEPQVANTPVYNGKPEPSLCFLTLFAYRIIEVWMFGN